MSTTSNLILCKGDLARNWTPTATQTATGYSVLSLINQYPSDFWKSTDKTANYLTFNGSTSYTVTIVFLLNHNITTGTLQLQYSDNDFTDKTDVNMTLVTNTMKRYNATTKTIESYNYHHSYAYMAGGVSKKDFRIKIDASGISDSYYRASEVCLFSDYYQVVSNFKAGYEWRIVSEMVENTGPYTQGPARSIKTFHRGVFPFRGITKAQLDQFDQIEIYGGVVIFPEGLAGAGCFYGQGFNENIESAGLISGDNKAFDFQFKEHV